MFSLSINYSRHPVQITALIEVLAITKANKVTSVPNQIVDVYCDDIVSLQTHSQIQTNTYITLLRPKKPKARFVAPPPAAAADYEQQHGLGAASQQHRGHLARVGAAAAVAAASCGNV